MISELADDTDAWMVLGTPWFKTVAVSLDFENNMVEIYQSDSFMQSTLMIEN